MNNLEGIELKNAIKKNILFALKNSKNPSIEITFQFQAKDFTHTEHISYFADYFRYKNISFDRAVFSTENILNIIIANFHIDHFRYISTIIKNRKNECHGHGEYWGTDEFTFVYFRIE